MYLDCMELFPKFPKFHKNRVSLYFIVHYAAKAGPGYSDRLGTKIAGNIENERGPSPGPQDTG